jgi:CrcB protein
MNGFFLVALGGALGASLRYSAGLLAVRHLPPGWPWATAFVNVTGSLAMGLLAGWLAQRDPGLSQNAKLFLATGLLGGFTTFSAFSFEMADFLRSGDVFRAAAYAGLSVIVCVAALIAGLWLARRLFS